MPYIMWLLPVLVLNLGFSFLTGIELHWKEREQDEIAQQELEALTRSATVESRLNRLAGLITDQLELAARNNANDKELEAQLRRLGQTSFARVFPEFKLHVFRKAPADKAFELFHAQSGKVESKRAMALIFNHLVDQHQGVNLPAETRKQRDKIGESYFGRTLFSEPIAVSQKGRTSFVVQDYRPHWFIWDYHNQIGKYAWGYMVAAEVRDGAKLAARQVALDECRRRGNGLAGFLPVLDLKSDGVLFRELEQSSLFSAWRFREQKPLIADRQSWLEYGPPAPAQLGNYRVYCHLGKNSDYMTVFLSRKPVQAGLPLWIRILNGLTGSIWILLVLRGLLLKQWLEMQLTLRFLMLYFLAATLPLGLLSTAAAAYQYQTSRSARNQIADNLEGCLRQIESRKMQIQEEYQKVSRQLFADGHLSRLIAEKGLQNSVVKETIVKSFKNRATSLPILGFYLLDAGGKGVEHAEDSSLLRLRDIFRVYRAPIVQNLRKQMLLADPGVLLPEFKVSEEEKLGTTAFDSLSGNSLESEIERRRNFCITLNSGEVSASFIYDYVKVGAQPGALLFIVWDASRLFEQSIGTAIDNFKLSLPEFSFIAFRNTTQGLKTHYRLEDDELTRDGFSESVMVAETAAARGSSVKTHLAGFSVVAMPFGMNSEVVIAGLAGHKKIKEDEAHRHLVFVLLIGFALFIAAICAYFTAAFLLKPITGLKMALDKVSERDYSVRLDSSRPDELGKLTNEFAKMVEGLKERERLSSLLSDHAVEALARKSGSSEVDCDSRVFSGIALVSDIRSFTTLCETHPTNDITAMLNQHFAAMAEAVAACGGRIYKFIGDAVEAVFDGEDAEVLAINAVSAAIRMNVALTEINRKRRESGLFSYAFGVGLAHGSFYAGSVGSEDTRLDYSIIGEAFGRAAQLEALTKKHSSLPIIFDQEIGALLHRRLKTVPVDGLPGAATFAEDDRLHVELAAEFATSTASGPSAPSIHDRYPGRAEPFSDSGNIFKLTAFVLSALFAILTGLGIYLGLRWHNQLAENLAGHRVAEHQFRLGRQLKAESSAAVAFESKIRQTIKKLESVLRFERQPEEEALIRGAFEGAMAEFATLGVSPSRVLAASFDEPGAGKSQLIFSHGLTVKAQEQFMLLARHMYLDCLDEKDPVLIASLTANYEEMFGNGVSAWNITTERIGWSSRVMNGNTPELLYWNYIRVLPDEMSDLPLPEQNWQIANLDEALERVAGIIIFAVPEADVQNNFKLLANGYAEPGLEIALRDGDGKIYRSSGFPADIGEGQGISSEKNGFQVSGEEIAINDQPCHFFVARSISNGGQINLKAVVALILLLVFGAIFFAYRSIYHESFLNRSIQFKLIFSVLLAALVPMLTVWFVSDSFVFENHQALLNQQSMELQRYLDEYEVRLFYNQQVLTRQFQEFAADDQILAIARELEKDPEAEEPRARLQAMYAAVMNKITGSQDWSSNARVRDILLISRNNWEVSSAGKIKQTQDTFAKLLSQVSRHILLGISPPGSGENHGKNLKMQDLKSEMFFESAMRSIRSNFGDEACIKLNNAFSQLIEFEITTGAAVMMAVPIPSIENPEFVVVWLASLTRGGYLSRVARHNRGPFAVFTIEYKNYGEIVRSFRPFPGVDPGKAAAWITSSNLPVSFEQTVGRENISIEGRPGIQRNDYFLVAAASQRPLDLTTSRIKEYLGYFMVLALLLFLFIGHQTASDIIIPVVALSEGMRQIGVQNCFYRINLDRHDELGQLCDSYDRFAKGLAEKELMGKMLSRGARLAAGGEEGMIVSGRSEFVFVFIGCPDFAERLQNEETAGLFVRLREQVTILCRIILEEGGDIDKLMGDKILGVLPAGAGNGLTARLAAMNAAAKILQAEKVGQLNFPVAIGINAGEVISGMLGFGAKRDFTVIGDAVNVSARIQKEAEKMPHDRCLFSESFVASFPGHDGFTLHARAALKGKSEAMLLYRRHS